MSHKKSFASEFPDKIALWSPENEDTPWDVGAWSHKDRLWVCEKGHTYRSRVTGISSGNGCGVCSNKQVVAGINDLATLRPKIAKEWHPTKNDLKPTQVSQGSGKKVWWLGECGHEWHTSITSRTDKGFGCTVCSGQTVQEGVNDLATTNPDLADEWHPDKNELKPTEVTAGSKRKVWWLGACGHEWKTDPGGRHFKKYGCPFCAGRKVLPGYNDLVTLEPHALEKWDFEKNEVQPFEVTPGSHKKVHWIDKCGHSWFAPIRHVAQKGYGCAVCAGKHGGFDGNTLAIQEPEIASEWHPDNDRTASEVTRVSGYRAMWVCEKGHEFTVRVCDRVNYQTGCPHCSGARESTVEKELFEFVRGLGVEARANDRSIVKGFEADVLCPGQKIAIEFNGLYWHSEKFLGKTYHADKTDAFGEAGYQLIHVWEDEWRDSRGAVERMIARKLGGSSEERINARDLTAGDATTDEARDFLDEYHVQRSVLSSVRMTLRDAGGRIRAIATFRKRSEEKWELTRFATNGIVRGGFSKLLKAFIEEFRPEEVVTFADRGVSDGGLYEAHGFTYDGHLEPDYKYVRNGNKREHKFNYRISRFKTDPRLKYEEGLTERQLAKMNNLHRIYDAGKVRWVWRAKMG